jgi:DNA-binding transcriptional LysR family regulator
MELTWIDDFIALEKMRHFTKAAEMRHTTQSAYSRRVMRLEEWLGCRLFERDTRPIQLTPEGHEFLTRAQRLRADIIDMKRAVNALASHYRQARRFYTTSTLAIGFFSQWAEQRDLKHYALTVSSVTACVEAVRTGRADHALIPLFDGIDTDSVHVDIIGEDHLRLMATPDIAKQIAVKNKHLQGPLLLYPPATVYGTAVHHALDAQQIAIADNAICESPSTEALHALAQNHMGAAWLPGVLDYSGLVECAVPKSLQIAYKIALISP